MEKITLKFYSIDRCGYFKHSGLDSKLIDISEILDDIKDWIEPQKLQETLTTNVLNAKAEQLPVYCINISSSKVGNYLMTTWNQVESTDGNISSIKIDEPIKTASVNVHSTSLPKDSISGYATYFYFIPEDNVVATIKFNHILNGRQGLNYYIKGFLTRFSKYTQYEVDKKDKSKITVLGYGVSSKNYDENLYPYFKSSLKKNKTNTKIILSHIPYITKIIKRTTLAHSIVKDKDLYKKLMSKLGVGSVSGQNEDFQLKYEMKIQPTKSNVKEIIRSWKRVDSWDDVGFKLKGQANPIWLSADIPTQEFDLNIKRTNNEFIDFQDLLDNLDSKIALIKKVYS